MISKVEVLFRRASWDFQDVNSPGVWGREGVGEGEGEGEKEEEKKKVKS